MADTTLIDPLGRQIILHERTWVAHILKGHPEVKPWRQLVERVVVSPSEIRYSTQHPDCRVYYGAGPTADCMVAVVADVVLGLVKTTHLARKPSPGRLEWS